MWAERAELGGWARQPRSVAQVRHPIDEATVLDEIGPRGVVCRGLGRAYGDAALNAGGVVEDMTAISSIIDFDPGAGELTARAGASLDAITRTIVPEGWWLPVVPGTRFVTLGGAFAADVHGKNHLSDGSFADHVTSVVLRTPDGVDHRLSSDDQVFWATAGGMGLTGAIIEMSLRLLRIDTGRILATHRRTPNLEATLAGLDEAARASRYAIAWLDLSHGGADQGRGIVSSGEHASASEADPATLGDALSPPRLTVPASVPSGLVNADTIRALNAAWWRRARARSTTRLEPFETFFTPLDAVAAWNRLYGRRGLLQYQLAVPYSQQATIARVADRLTADRVPTLLAVLKRFGPGHGLLSFPIEGWTLAFDVPLGVDGLATTLRELDELVASARGRVYLAKDARLSADMLRRMYPGLDEWQAVRRRLDPERRMRSDLSRRLEL